MSVYRTIGPLVVWLRLEKKYSSESEYKSGSTGNTLQVFASRNLLHVWAHYPLLRDVFRRVVLSL